MLPDGVAASIFRVGLPLKRPVRTGPVHVLEASEGVLVRIRDDAGNEGWGEATSLPGFTSASVADLITAARRWSLQSAEVGPPALAFAVDSALVALKAQRLGITLAVVLGARRGSVEMNALLNDGDDLDAWTAGHHPRSVKLKVGRRTVDEDVERVRHVRRLLPSVVRLRLDANRAWDLESARRFLNAVANLDIEYLEEPLRDPAELPLIANEFGTPLALDETIRELSASDLAALPWCAAVVLKPSLLGSLERYQGFVDAASANGSTVVLSSAYESGIGTRMLVAMAAALPLDAAHGFAPYRLLAADVLEPRLDLESHQIDVSTTMAPRRIRTEQMDRIV